MSEIEISSEDRQFIDLCEGYIEKLQNFRQRWKQMLEADLTGRMERNSKEVEVRLDELEDVKEPLKNDGMQGNEELPTEPYVAIRRKGGDEIDETVRVFQRFLNIWCNEFAEAMGDFIENASVCAASLIKTPWKNEAHFSHNMGVAQFQDFWSMVNNYLLGRYVESSLPILINNLPHFIDQLICHFQAVIEMLQGKQGKTNENPEQEKNSIIEAMQMALRARLFFGGLNIPGISDEQVGKAPRAMLLGDCAIQSSISLAQLVEMVYVPVSNAHRIMGMDEHPENLTLEVSVREITYQGEKLLVLEFFNTGKAVDLNALQRKLLKFDEASLARTTPALSQVIKAIHQGSRQAHLQASEEILILDGLTLTTGGTGIGLNDLHHQLEKTDGALLLNNVYHPKEGFCVTIILPQSESIDPGELMKKIRELKELLQTGKYFLEKVEVDAGSATQHSLAHHVFV